MRIGYHPDTLWDFLFHTPMRLFDKMLDLYAEYIPGHFHGR